MREPAGRRRYEIGRPASRRRYVMSEGHIDRFERVLAWSDPSVLHGEQAAAALLALPAAARAAALAADPSLRTVDVFESLLVRAHELLDRAPAESLAITDLVLPWMSEVSVPNGAETLLELFHSTAWKERGWALRASGNLLGALDAVERSIEAAGDAPHGSLAHADARVLEACVRQDLGDTAAAFEAVDDAETIYLRWRNPVLTIKARMMKAALLYENGDCTAAERLWLDALADAELLGDRASAAACFGNLGQCAARLGNDDEAVGWFTKALPLLSELRMEAERPRVLWGLARVCAHNGRTDKAIARLTDVRNHFLMLGMLLDAACVSLDIVELLMNANRAAETRAIASDLVLTFTNAGMKANALAAMAFLRDALANDALIPEPIHRVRRYIARLRQDPALPFAA